MVVLTLILSLSLSLCEKGFGTEVTDQHSSVQSVDQKFLNLEANIWFLCLNVFGEVCKALEKLLEFR